MRKHGLLTTAVIAATSLIGATAALAGGSGITLVTKDRPAQNSPIVRPMAHCPTGDHVLGGGFSDFGTAGIAQRNKPIHKTGWRVAYLQFAGPGSDSATAYALCEAASARNLKVVSHTGVIPAGTSGGPGENGEKGITATCPSGMDAISGGYSVRPRYKAVPPPKGVSQPGEVSVDTDKRSGSNKWYVHAGNDGPKNGLAVFAICQPSGTSTITQVADTEPAQSNDVEADATCPTGHVVGGGFAVRPTERNGGLPFVTGSFPSQEDTWTTLQQFSSFKQIKRKGLQPADTLTSFAECES